MSNCSPYPARADPRCSERSGQTTHQTLIFEATTSPTGQADIIDGPIEEGAVYHHYVEIIARTANGNAAAAAGWGYLVIHPLGSPNIQIFTEYTPFMGSINPLPTSEVLAVVDHRILRVYGNGQDTLQWSAVVDRIKMLAPGQ